MKSFYVLVYDFNRRTFVPYNVIPYLEKCYHEKRNKPKTVEEFKSFITGCSAYQFEARCEYEIVLSDWPNKSTSKKIDVHFQILLNLDIITKILMEIVNDR